MSPLSVIVQRDMVLPNFFWLVPFRALSADVVLSRSVFQVVRDSLLHLARSRPPGRSQAGVRCPPASHGCKNEVRLKGYLLWFDFPA